MSEKFKVRTKVIEVEFEFSNYARTATISMPEFCNQLIRVKPLWTNGLNDVLLDYSESQINLRWFDSDSVYSGKLMYGIKKFGTLVRPVEIHYVSVILDRNDKLDVLGVD
jgi:hypothetical protein